MNKKSMIHTLKILITMATILLVEAATITSTLCSTDVPEGEERYEVSARLLLPEELKETGGELSVIYEGEETDIFLELNAGNDYTAEQYVPTGTYSLFANIANGNFAGYSFWTKKSFDVNAEKVVIDVYVMENAEYLNADLYEESPIGLSECGEAYASRQEQRIQEASAAVHKTEKAENVKSVPVEKVDEKPNNTVVEDKTMNIEEVRNEIETLNFTGIVAICFVIIVIILLLLYMLLIRPRKRG